MSDQYRKPFSQLGSILKSLRVRRKESVADVSGAVEIDEKILDQIEKGLYRPSEEVLLLLISHFEMPDDEADRLWHMAGYTPPHDEDDDYDHDHDEYEHEHHSQPSPQNGGRGTLMIMAIDPRVVYADGVQVVTNPGGIILNFAQGTGTKQAMIAGRIGMSREQAEATIFALQQALHPTPKHLSQGQKVSDNSPKSSSSAQNQSVNQHKPNSN